MRDKNFRRRQEAKHYNKRLELYSLYGSIGIKGTPRKEDGTIDFVLMREMHTEYDDFKPKKLKRCIHTPDDLKCERWGKKLKNGDVKLGLLDKWDKKYCNKTRRNLQKTVDYQLKPHRWYDRKHVNPQAKGYSTEEYIEEE